MSESPPTTCPDDSTLLAFCTGELSPEAWARTEGHLAHCDDCLQAVAAVAEATREQAKQGLSGAGDGGGLLGYEIVAFIARGGMGRVYEGVQRRTGRRVAIKILETDESEAGYAELLSRFVREGEVLRRLNHPNIVQLLDVLADGGRHHLIMEYVSGGSLRDLLQREGALPAERAIRISLELCDALARAHHLGVLHRDIKPANVLLAEDGTPRLADFGLARTAGEKLTRTGTLLGTIPYLSPEALWGKGIDERADLWSLGVSLFELATGRLPFIGHSQASIVTAILHQPLPDLGALGLPVALAELLQRMLEKDPARRIASARQVGSALETLLRADGGEPAAAAARPASPVAVPAVPPRAERDKDRRERGLLLFLWLTLVAWVSGRIANTSTLVAIGAAGVAATALVIVVVRSPTGAAVTSMPIANTSPNEPAAAASNPAPPIIERLTPAPEQPIPPSAPGPDDHAESGSPQPNPARKPRARRADQQPASAARAAGTALEAGGGASGSAARLEFLEGFGAPPSAEANDGDWARRMRDYPRCAQLFLRAYDKTRWPSFLLDAAQCQYDANADRSVRATAERILTLDPPASDEVRAGARKLLELTSE